jgi:hypothetical protein
LSRVRAAFTGRAAAAAFERFGEGADEAVLPGAGFGGEFGVGGGAEEQLVLGAHEDAGEVSSDDGREDAAEPLPGVFDPSVLLDHRSDLGLADPEVVKERLTDEVIVGGEVMGGWSSRARHRHVLRRLGRV